MGNHTHNLGRKISEKMTTWKSIHEQENNIKIDIGKKYGVKMWIQLNKHRVKFRSLINIAMYIRIQKTVIFQIS